MAEERFGDYVLLERVAVGGMAEVFRARLAREGGVQRQVCIKRVHPKHSADPSFSAMFIDEARIGVTLAHGNIVPVFDFGCVDGLYYLAMELVEGRDLAQIAARVRIAGRRWPTELALHVTREILEGLEYAHERRDESGRPLNIVHRDVSPANVLVSRSGEVKIADFGIARAESRELETRTGVVKGTPGYMAPEQAAGRRPDRRADVYASAVILWELLQSERAPKDGLALPVVDDERIVPVLARALDPDPDQRFPTARDFHEALGALMAADKMLPSSRDLQVFVDEAFETPAPTDDWRWAEMPQPSKTTTAPARGDLPSRPPDAALAAPSTERVGSLAPSPSIFVEKVRPRLGRRALVLAIALASLAAGLALAFAPGTGETPRRRTGPARVRSTGSVHVITLPAGARATLDDGRPVATPARFDAIRPGTHRVSIEKDGFEPVVRGLVVLAGENASIELPLHPRRASLRIASIPPGRVTVDGHERGTSPVEVAGLDPDVLHRVEIGAEGHEPLRTDLRLARGETRDLAPRLHALSRGTLTVNVSDWAEVFLDGQRIGNTPIVGYSVAAGTHRLECKNPHRGIEKRLSIVVRPRAEVRLAPW